MSVLPITNVHMYKVKVMVLHPVQQPGSYWDRTSALPIVELSNSQVTGYD